MFNQTQVLENAQIQRLAPSVFASEPWERMSANYKFIPTIDVVNAMRDNNFLPVMAAQSRTRIAGKGNFTKHMLRFRHADHMSAQNVGEEIPEIVLVNSHDGTSAYKLMAGIFRLVCSNGMIVQASDMGSINVRHSGRNDLVSEVIEGSYQIIDETPKHFAQIGEFKQIELNRDQQRAFAAAALELKSDKAAETFTADHILQARRMADMGEGNGKGRDLWKTMNVVQENLIRGGASTRNTPTRRRATMRAVKSVSEDVRINKALWTLTEQMAKLAVAA